MRTVLIHECARPRCGAMTIYGCCALHESPEQRLARWQLQAALLVLADAEEAWLAAQGTGDPVATVIAENRWRRTQQRAAELEASVGIRR
jgi:endonuclease/exonuclease/phosphatase (EEP) superfamily protein YafD